MSSTTSTYFCVLTIRKQLPGNDFERSGRGQEPSRGHKFSILEKLVRHRDFTSQTLSSFPSDFVGAALVGATPLHLLSQTALPLKSPTGAFVAPLRCANASLPRGRQNRLIMQTTKNRKFPLGNSLLYISLSYVALIASFTSRANLNNLFAICNSRLLPTNQIVNCDSRVRLGGRTLFFTMLHHFLRAASGIRHQHGSGSDAAHPGIVPIFCAGMPCKRARKQCHFPAYCPILSA